MVRMVCRLKCRKGEPLGLTKCPALTFTLLPLEIRNKIYQLLLVKPEPIDVFTRQKLLWSDPDPSGPSKDDEPWPESKVASVTFGLLEVNRMISLEAAAVFYHHNVFKFSGSYNDPLRDPWNLLYSFLYTIGARNRAHLRYLEAEIARPEPVLVDSEGTVSSIHKCSNWIRTVHGRDHHTRIYPPVDRQYHVQCADYVNPGIEAVFRILGPEGSSLRLLLLPGFENLPGAACYAIDLYTGEDPGVWRGDIPDLIERLRRQFSTFSSPNGTGIRVDVQWQAMFRKQKLESKAAMIETDGWDLLGTRDTIGPMERFFSNQPARRTTCVTFRRKWLTEFEAR